MQRFLLFLSSGLLFAGSTQAQFGLRAGSNLTGRTTESLLSEVGTSSVSRFGYQVGLSYQQVLTKRLAVVPEVQFSRERQQVYVNTFASYASSRSSYRLNLSYLNVPVLVRFTVGPGYLEAGAQGSLLVGGRGEGATTGTTSAGTTYAQDIDQAATARYRRFEAGPCLGTGVKLPAGLGVNLRVYQSLVPLSRDDRYLTSQDIPYIPGKQHRQTLQASLTYQVSTHQ